MLRRILLLLQGCVTASRCKIKNCKNNNIKCQFCFSVVKFFGLLSVCVNLENVCNHEVHDKKATRKSM